MEPAQELDRIRRSQSGDRAAFEALLTQPPGREPSAEPDYLVDPL